RELVDHRVDRVLQLEDLALHVDRDLAREVARGDGLRDVGDVSDLRRQVAGHGVHGLGQVLPRARHARDLGLTAQAAFRSDLACDARHFRRERRELVDHRVDRVLELEDLAFHVDRDLSREVAGLHRLRHVGDVSHLRRQVAGHRVHGVGQVAPRPRDALHVGLAAELAFGADLARDARHLGREAAELVDHDVDGVLELGDLAFDVDGDLLRQVAGRHGRRDLGDVSHLRRQVAGHRVHGLGQVLPRAGHTLHVGLTAELAFGADLARDARHLGREASQLVDHGIDRRLELEHLAFHVDRDLLREIACGDRLRDLGDVANLRGEVAGHEVHGLGQILPRAGHTFDGRLAAELAFGADLARDARHFGREASELVDHRVDGVLELQDLALDVDGDLLREVAGRDGLGDVGDVSHLRRQVTGHRVHGIRQVLPSARHALDARLAAQDAVRSDLARDARHFRRERAELVHHRVDGALHCEELALDVHLDLLREVALRDGRRDVGDVADLCRQVAGHRVHGIREVLPRARDAFDFRLAAEFALGAHLARDARHLGAEVTELVHHLVDRFRRPQELAFERPAFELERHALAEVALRDGADDPRDLARRVHEVVDQRVHAFDRLRPEAARSGQGSPAFQLALLADDLRKPSDLVRERRALLDDLVEHFRHLAERSFAGQGQADRRIAAPERRKRHEDGVHLLALSRNDLLMYGDCTIHWAIPLGMFAVGRVLRPLERFLSTIAQRMRTKPSTRRTYV